MSSGFRFLPAALVLPLLLAACSGGSSGSDNTNTQPVISACEQSGDTTAPIITITSPARGSTIVASPGQTSVHLQGSISDNLSKLESVTINGNEVALPTDSSDFTLDLDTNSQWGLNVIDVVATDTCGNQSKHAQSYLFSENYLPPSTATDINARVNNAQTVKLTQDAIDDGDRSDVNDLATFAERYMQATIPAQFSQFLYPGRVLVDVQATPCNFPYTDLGYKVIIGSPGASIGSTYVNSATLVTNGIDYTQTVTNISIPLSVTGRTCLGNVGPYNVTFTASSVYGTANIMMAIQNGGTTVNVPSTNVTVSGLNISSTNIPSSLDWLTAFVNNQIRGTVSSYINSAISAEIGNLLPSIASSFLDGFTTVELNIPANSLYQQTLNSSTGLETLNINSSAITQGFYTQLYPGGVGTPYATAEGAITRDIAAPDLTSNPGPFTVAVNDNFINQALWALWYGGGLEKTSLQDYVKAIPGNTLDLNGVTVAISALLPPVLMPGKDDDNFAFGLGDLKVKLDVDLDQNSQLPGSGIVNVEAYVNIRQENLLSYNFDTGALEINGDNVADNIHVDIASIKSGGKDVADPALLAAINDYISKLSGQLVDQLSLDSLQTVPLPPPQLTLPVPAAVGVSSVNLDIQSFGRRDSNFAVDADIDALWDGVLIDDSVWPNLPAPAAEAARSEVKQWLTDAKIRAAFCYVDGEKPLSPGAGVLGSGYRMGSAIKSALLAAGAPINLAISWNNAFKQAWSQFSGGTTFNPRPIWFPSFESYALKDYAQAFNEPTRIGDTFGSPNPNLDGNILYSAIKSKLIADNITLTPAADAAIRDFANQIDNRLTEFYNNGIIQNVVGEGYAPSMYKPLNPEPGPVVGYCHGKPEDGFGSIIDTTAFDP